MNNTLHSYRQMIQSKPIRIFTPDTMELVGEIDDYESFQLTRRYADTGEFELHMNLKRPHASLLKKGHFLMLGNDRESAGIISYLAKKKGSPDTIMVKGSTLVGAVLGRRLIVPPGGQAYQRHRGRAEDVIHFFIDKSAISVEDFRRIPQLVMNPSRHRGRIMTYQSRLKNLADEVSAIATAAGLGLKMELAPEENQFVFDVYEGKNRAIHQSSLPPVIFSSSWDQMESMEYTETDGNRKTCGYIAGDGEGAERRIVIVNNDRRGMDRIETFIDARDIQPDENGQQLTDEEINELLMERGEQKLAQMATERSLEAKVTHTQTFRYREDWGLGDMVTVEDREWGVVMDTRVSEVKEIYEPNRVEMEITFGNSVPTLTGRIKQGLSLFEYELTR